MKLDLFITHYKEPLEIGEKGFQMIRMQRNVDWSQIRVTVVHDGTEKFPDSYFAGFPCEINQVSIPHGGIAEARNWCIDHSDAEWIKWNDFDDMFACVYAMKDIMNAVNMADEFDLLWFDVLAELKDGKVYVKDQRDPVVIHGKVFRRQFLLDHQLRFPKHLTWCEDSAFLAVMEMEIDHQRIGKITCKCPIYAWIERDGSLCNRPEIRFQNLQSFFERHIYVAEEFRKHGLIDQYNTMCVRVMCDSYYTLNLAPNITDDKSEHEARVWAWFDEHREQFYSCRPEMFDMVITAVNRECFDGGEITKQAVMDWINKHERSVA